MPASGRTGRYGADLLDHSPSESLYYRLTSHVCYQLAGLSLELDTYRAHGSGTEILTTHSFQVPRPRLHLR